MSPHRVPGVAATAVRATAGLRGRLFFHAAPGIPGFGAFVYLPLSQPRPRAVTLLIHGITRNAAEQVARLAPLAEQVGTALVAPLFARALFPRYQTLAAKPGLPDPATSLDALIDSLGASLELDMRALRGFGFSGGGQFLHRYAMAQPQRFARIAIGAAGWYTFPDPLLGYPQGVAGWSRWTPATAAQFLALPVRVLVGSKDNRRDPTLNRSPAIDAQQGHDRVARGRHWVAALRARAEADGIASAASFRKLHGVSHNFAEAVSGRGYGESVFEFLFPHDDEAST